MRYVILLVFFVVLISCDTANKFDAEVENYFVKFYGEDGNHTGVDFVANSDGSFILVGNENTIGSTVGQQIYVVKVDPLGTVILHERFGADGNDFAKDIELTPDGNIIIVGETQTVANTRDVYMLILDQNLGLIKEKIVSGILKTLDGEESDEEVNSISTISNGYIVSGATTAVKTPTDTKDAMHLRFTPTLDLIEEGIGNATWSYTSGKGESEDVLIKMIEIEIDTLFYGFGYSNRKINLGNNNDKYKYWAFGLNNTGLKKDFDDVFGSGNSVNNDILSSVIKSPKESGEGYVLSGIKSNASGESQSYILKLGKELVQGQNNVLNEETPTELGANVGGVTSMTNISSGGYLLLTNSKFPTKDNLNISLIKLSNTLKSEWSESIYFGGVGDDFSGSVRELPDGKIMIIGTMTLGGVTGQTKMVLMKLNKDGKLMD